MHSISTSVFKGSVLTATHLDEVSIFPRIYATTKYIRPAWLHITPVLRINRVHTGKIIHIGQEYIDLDDLIDVRSGGFEDMSQVFDTLVLLLSAYFIITNGMYRRDAPYEP